MQEDLVDVKSRHKGKLDSEAYLHKIGIPYTAVRPTYIYGALNYNPLGTSCTNGIVINTTVYLQIFVCAEEYFFTRLAANRTLCVPSHGQYLTGLGHVKDLAVAMAQILGRDGVKGKAYNIQVAVLNYCKVYLQYR